MNEHDVFAPESKVLTTLKQSLPVPSKSPVPLILQQAGTAAQYAWDEFFMGHLRNPGTRIAYERSVRRFLKWAEPQVDSPAQITPRMVAEFIESIPGKVPTRKLYLSALRQFFDVLVQRHLMVINPAHSVKGERYVVADGEGLTPEITIEQSRALLHSIPLTSLVQLRDAAILATLIYTGAREGAVATLKRGSLLYDGTQYCLHFQEKGGKQRRIPVRTGLQELLLTYLEHAGIIDAPKDSPFFRSALGRTGKLTDKPIGGLDIYRMMKRRLSDAQLPPHLVPHSIRACVVTDLLLQGLPLEEIQFLVGHADPRTTRLYDRRKRNVSRNLVERISV